MSSPPSMPHFEPSRTPRGERPWNRAAVRVSGGLGGTPRRTAHAGWESIVVLANDPDSITPLVESLQEDLGRIGLGDEEVRMQVGLSLQEALVNALYHGNLEVDSELLRQDERAYYELVDRRRRERPFRDRRAFVHAWIAPGEARYEVRDEGPGFDVKKLRDSIDPEDLGRVGGRGLLLIRAFMDEVWHNQAGNRITMVKRARGGGRPAATF